MAEKLLSEFNEEEMKNLVGSFDTIITFCEGVLSNSDKAISGSSSAIDVLKKCGKRILYFSRDCSSSRREISDNMRKNNYELNPNEIVCVTSLLAKYLKKRLNERKVYVIGSTGISEELDGVGLRNFGIGPDVLTTDLATFVHSHVDDPEMGAVVVGFDEHFSYPKMLRAASYLSVKEVVHIATSVRNKKSAALVACIETCSEKEALVFDNSGSIMIDILIDDYRLSPDRTLLIAPGKNGNVCLARLKKFQHFLTFDEDQPSLKISSNSSPKNDDSREIIWANDLTELASRLKIS